MRYPAIGRQAGPIISWIGWQGLSWIGTISCKLDTGSLSRGANPIRKKSMLAYFMTSPGSNHEIALPARAPVRPMAAAASHILRPPCPSICLSYSWVSTLTHLKDPLKTLTFALFWSQIPPKTTNTVNPAPRRKVLDIRRRHSAPFGVF
jgi:hypothetical protein